MKRSGTLIGRMGLGAAAVVILGAGLARARGSWFDEVVRKRESAPAGGAAARKPVPLPDFGTGKYTVTLWVKTTRDGAIFSKTAPTGNWVNGGKGLFIRNGRLAYDVGWVGAAGGRKRIADGKWHHVAFCGGSPQMFYVDGVSDGHGDLKARADVKGNAFKLGNISRNFPNNPEFRGELDDVRIHGRVLSGPEIKAEAEATSPRSADALIGYWPFDGDPNDASRGLNHASPVGRTAYSEGKFGKALKLSGSGHMLVECGEGKSPDAELWRELAAGFKDEQSKQEMAWERADGIWGPDWQTAGWDEIAKRYAKAATKPTSVAREIAAAALRVRTSRDIVRVREVYLKSRRYGQLLEQLADFKLDELRATVGKLHGTGREGRRMLARLDELEGQATRWEDGPPSGGAFESWKAEVKALRRDAIFNQNPLIDFDKLVFVKRLTYSANHYYTEYVNARWTPGGGLCILDLKTGDVKELATELGDGIVMRFDVSFDAKRIVFDWKCDAQQGYRIYEIGVDGSGLRQLTFPQDDDEELVRKYRAAGQYHHGTDDMHPCYLPDGGICFISTRCQYGILCDSPDNFSTTILYRMDSDGRNMRPLTNSSVSEASPVMLPDGRIMYTRWEYVDKGAVSVKCLWAMRPDGSSSAEIYANDISLPPTFIYGRPIPGVSNGYVVLGTPHYPNNGLGTVIRLDMTKDIRSRDPMTYMTPYIDIRGEGGFSVKVDGGRWKRDDNAPLFRDPYPLSKEFFLVAHKPQGKNWRDQTGYGIHLLDETGGVQLVYKDPKISCWQPFPLKPRTRPPVLESPIDERMAAKGLATCVVTDIYHGMEDTPRGSIKYIRVIEQVPRPWATRRRWGGDCYDQQHATISKRTHLGLKVQHGVVPVEDDGSAHFVVPSMKNIIFQALDENYMAVQTERTYVNYMPGESRSCIGCHETPNDAAAAKDQGVVKALRRPASVPGPQLGEKSGKRPLDFVADVQPVLDKHCVKCHGGDKPKAGLDLRGTMTKMFSRSYENLLNKKYMPFVGENHPKTGNIHYMPARSYGSHNSLLVAIHSRGKVKLADGRLAARAAELAGKHGKVKLAPEELLKITNWVDTNGQFYGMYWGRKNLQHKDHPNFRPVPTFARAASYVSEIPEGDR